MHCSETGECQRKKEKCLSINKKEMMMTSKGISIMLTVNFLTTARETRKEWKNIFTELSKNNCQLKILYPA